MTGEIAAVVSVFMESNILWRRGGREDALFDYLNPRVFSGGRRGRCCPKMVGIHAPQ